MEKKIKLTVIMSTYNGEKYLREQLDSILAQDINEWGILKILVRDDGSSDDTVKILEEYKISTKGKLDYYTGENLRTAGSFWNLVNRVGEADYYSFSDQDDVWFKDKLSRAVKKLESMGDGPLLYCSEYTAVDSNMKQLDIVHDELNKFTDFPHSLLYSTAPGCTFVFNEAARREMVKYDMGRYFPEIHDWLAHRIITMTGRMYFDETPSMYYRQHGDNVIGMQSGGIKGLKRRIKMFLSGSTESIRARCAGNLLKIYGDELDTDRREILREVAYYRKNSAYRKKFLKDKRFCPGGINTLFLKFLIITKRI